jgi:hypothetical protein
METDGELREFYKHCLAGVDRGQFERQIEAVAH